MIKAVIFDLDGTLVNSLCDLADSTNFALSQFGFPTHEVEKFKYFVGDGMPKLIERALPLENNDQQTKTKVLEVFMQYYRNHYADKTSAYDGVLELLENLRASGFKMAVVSNKADEMTGVVVKKVFSDVFDIVTGKRENYPAKPNPQLTLKVIEDLGVKAEECAFVGDSGMDMATAVNSGCVPLGVLWGFRTEEELKNNGAKFIAKTPQEVLHIIRGIV